MTNEHTEIVIAVFEGENRANEVLVDIDETTTSELEALRDQVTVISLDEQGKLSASAPKKQKRQSTLGGALVGVLVGAAVGVPVVGAVLGGVVGAWRVAKRKKSDQDFSLDQVTELMTPDSSLVVAEVEDWRVVSVSSDADLVTGWGYVQLTYAVIGLVVFVVLGLITNFISQGITRPVHQLQQVMRSVETGEFRQAGDLRATDEIRELAREYDLMVSRIRDLMAANDREQELKRKSDLRALQAQINPHFLYNTLDSIVWMAEMDRSPEVVKMTTALSRLFRISISRGRELIPLRDELDHVRNYLTIQKLRYQDQFHYAIEVDDSLLDYTVLKIILQPLVENAIYHGVRNLSSSGLIEIGGAARDGTLQLWVHDNGMGMGPEELGTLLSRLRNAEGDSGASEGQGLGVINVHQRIQLYFGSGYGLQVTSEPEAGTTITCTMPCTQWVESG